MKNNNTIKKNKVLEMIDESIFKFHKALNESDISEEKQKDTDIIRTLNLTAYITTNFRKGAGGEDTPKAKITISMTPGKALELFRPVTDEAESLKFNTGIKADFQKLFRAIDKHVDGLINKYGLKHQEEIEVPPADVPAPEADTNVDVTNKSAPKAAPAPATKPAPAKAAAPTPAPRPIPVKKVVKPAR